MVAGPVARQPYPSSAPRAPSRGRRLRGGRGGPAGRHPLSEATRSDAIQSDILLLLVDVRNAGVADSLVAEAWLIAPAHDRHRSNNGAPIGRARRSHLATRRP